MRTPRFRSRLRGRRATAAVELAVTLPLILSLLVGIYESARIVEVEQLLLNAAREGARQAATGQMSTAQVQQVTAQYLKVALNDTAGTMTQNAVVTVKDLTHPGVDMTAATSLDLIQVTVTIPYQDVRWTTLTFVTNPSTTISGQVTWVSLVDVAYPSTTPQPPTG